MYTNLIDLEVKVVDKKAANVNPFDRPTSTNQIKEFQRGTKPQIFQIFRHNRS